jgi:ribose 5-phosphate isomerase B
MKIAVASDHAGFSAKEMIKNYLTEKGHIVEDFGSPGEEPFDYPDSAYPAARSIAEGRNEKGVFCCGSGNGVNITANKVKGVRSALAYNNEVAALAAADTGCQVICFGARFMNADEIRERIDVWLGAPLPSGRHLRRINKINGGEK